MINLRIIARAFSQILIAEGIFMLLSAGVAWIYREHAALSILFSAIVTMVTGLLVFTPLRHAEKVYGTRESYIIGTCIWLLFSLFGTLPYLFTSSAASFTDAFFESVSGFTTTGATVFRDVESLPNGILFWRSTTQWIGGISILVMSLYILPIVKSLNVQLPTVEFSGQTTDKIHPKVIEAIKRIVFIYVTLTFAEVIFLVAGGMTFLEALCHSFSTLSTGGFSIRNNGIASFTSPFIKAVISVFMFFAGANPAIFYFAIKGYFRKIFSNNEFVVYCLLIILSSGLIALVLLQGNVNTISTGISDAFFHSISIITTTGFYTTNFGQWNSLLSFVIFILMFTGAMAGSASGGIKIIRLIIIIKNNRSEIKRLVHPKAYAPVRVDRKVIPENIVYNLLVFVILYLISVSAGALLLSLLDYDIITSFGTAASMLGNIGPGLGTFGPFATYTDLADPGKWILSALMMLGRLELLAIMVLFSVSFYKR